MVGLLVSVKAYFLHSGKFPRTETFSKIAYHCKKLNIFNKFVSANHVVMRRYGNSPIFRYWRTDILPTPIFHIISQHSKMTSSNYRYRYFYFSTAISRYRYGYRYITTITFYKFFFPWKIFLNGNFSSLYMAADGGQLRNCCVIL